MFAEFLALAPSLYEEKLGTLPQFPEFSSFKRTPASALPVGSKEREDIILTAACEIVRRPANE